MTFTTHNFVAGDLVRCENAVGCYRIHKGKVYKVADVDPTCVTVWIYSPTTREVDVSRVRADRFSFVQKGKGLGASAVDFMFNRPGLPAPNAVEQQQANPPIGLPQSYAAWCKFLAAGGKLKFRSGCDVKFVAFCPDAKPHCQLVLLNPTTGNVVTRYANGKGNTETYDEPGDILVKE